MDIQTAEQAALLVGQIDNLIEIKSAIEQAFDGDLLFRSVTLSTGPSIVFLDSGISAGTTKDIFNAFMQGLQSDIDNLTAQLAGL